MFKKCVCVLLILLSIFCLPIISYGTEEMTASDFSLLLDDFIETNEQYQSQSVFNSSEDEIDISTNRLIVVTDNNNTLTDDCNAIDKLEGFNNWHIFQYSSESTASTAYAYFNNQEYVNHVEYDTVFHIDDYNDESESFMILW